MNDFLACSAMFRLTVIFLNVQLFQFQGFGYFWKFYNQKKDIRFFFRFLGSSPSSEGHSLFYRKWCKALHHCYEEILSENLNSFFRIQ